MTSRSKKYLPLVPLAVLAAFATAPKPEIAEIITRPAIAQSAPAATFPLPTSVAAGTKVAVEQSSSMQNTVDNLKQSFEKQYSGTNVAVTPTTADAAVSAVAAGKADVAVIGRPLTEAEKAQGLVAVPFAPKKIAMIVGPDSPFKGSLTIDQFAQIFRGEINNWAQVGGPSAPVRLIDRPATSDTRQAFQNYPVFQNAPFQAGSNAVQVEDSTAAVIGKLGNDGLGYAIVDQVEGQPGVRILEMHNTLPTDPRYPFSQKPHYVYKGPEPTAGAKAFLGFVTTPEGQRGVIAVSPAPAASPAPEATVSPQAPAPEATAPATTATETQGPSPWWWLLLPLIGIPLLAWLFRGGKEAPAAAPVAAATTANRIILTPRNCRDAYAYWELPDYAADRNRNLALRLYDVTGIDMDRQQPHSMKQFDVKPGDQDMHLPIALDDRDYLVEVGYPTEGGGWTSLARSTHVRVPKCGPTETVLPTGKMGVGTANVGTAAAAAAAALTGAGAAAAATVGKATSGDRAPYVPPTPVSVPSGVKEESRIILVPRSPSDGYAYWEVPEAYKAAARREGGENLKLRLYDVTNINLDTHPAHSMAEFDVLESDNDRHIPIHNAAMGSLSEGRDYLVELGYKTPDGRWIKLARSEHAYFPTTADQSVL